MVSNRSFRVLLAMRLHTAAGRKELNGVYRFLGEGHYWDIDLIRTETDLTPNAIVRKDADRFDGLLIATGDTTTIRSAYENLSAPVVFIDYPHDWWLLNKPRTVFIHDQTERIVRTAVNHLLKCRGVRHLGFVPTRTPRRWSSDRCAAFAALMQTRDLGHSVFAGDGESRDALTAWLQALPKPAGVIGTFDDRANDVLECCRAAGIDVPADVSVLGIGNDETLCDNTRPPLSSVAIDFEHQGYQAARELHALLLRRAKPVRREIEVGDNGVVARDSTALPSDAASLARKAEAFIDAHACEGIGVDDVVRHLRVSRRLADLRFRETTGRTILETIQSRRLREARVLLSTTTMPVAFVAERCGYSSDNYFKNAFRRQTGLSPRNWRKAHAS